MRATRTLFLLALLLAPLPPAVALEKCVSPAGKVSYSEAPCPPGWKSSTVRGTAPSGVAPGAAAAPGPAGSKAPAATARAGKKGAASAKSVAMAGERAGGKVEIRYADVQGEDYESLLAALKAVGGPHLEAAWKLAYDYEPRRVGKVCRVGSLTTRLELVMTLPRWQPPRGAPQRLTSQWLRYVSALRKHSEGHFGVARDFEEALHDSLRVTSNRCEKLQASIRSQFELLEKKHREQDRRYDSDTVRGRTEGAEFVLR